MSTGIREQLQAIRDEHGSLTPALVVDTARDPEHPLHSHFDWDDSVAAEKWRREQAGQLLRVTFRPDPTKPVDLRAFVAVKGEESHQSDYWPLDEVVADPLASKLMLRAMERDWHTFQRRYDHMAEFAHFVRDQLKQSKGKSA